MFCYCAYDLEIGSEIPLPELRPASTGADVTVLLRPAGPVVAAKTIAWPDHPFGEASFAFPKAGWFVVRGGREVVIRPAPGADDAYLRMYVQGIVLAAILYQRGSFVLHASVVNVNGRAIALIGPVGAGKSSLASAFYARGHSVIADDNAAIELGSAPRVLSAFPVLKVYPDIAASLGHDRIALRSMHHSQLKVAQPVEEGFSRSPADLAAIFVLDREASPGTANILPAVEAITELIRHSVPTRWGLHGNGSHLRQCAQLVRRTPLFRVRTFSELDEISRVVDCIERKISALW